MLPDKGQYLGASCETSCHAKLLHVYCNPASGKCECEKNYPVKLNPYTGCGKRKQPTVQFNKPPQHRNMIHSEASGRPVLLPRDLSIHRPAFRVHTDTPQRHLPVQRWLPFRFYSKTVEKSVLCGGWVPIDKLPRTDQHPNFFQDLVVMTTDFSAFAGVLSGIAILSGLICFVLRLFNQNMYGPRRHRFGNANLAPPILFSSDPGKIRFVCRYTRL